MNPYEPCVWNKSISGKQMTIFHHIDDLMISHKCLEVVTRYIKSLELHYASQDPLTVTRGLIHEYLGMIIDSFIKGKCYMSQYDCIKNSGCHYLMIGKVPIEVHQRLITCSKFQMILVF